MLVVQVTVSLELFLISYMVIHVTSDKLVLVISRQTQNISLKAIPRVHGMTIWPICHCKVHGLMHSSFKQLLSHKTPVRIHIVESHENFSDTTFN